MKNNNKAYWNLLAEWYQKQNHISLGTFHLGPLLPSADALDLLPADLSGHRCLELGCGAGQNSIVLAARGASCRAIDISEEQIGIGWALAAERGVELAFEVGDMEAFEAEPASLDFIHSTYALPFASDPAALAARIAEALAPGGSLLISTGHPLYAGEWLEIPDGEQGIFIADYRELFSDIRVIEEIEVSSTARFHPISTNVSWFTDAGLVVDRLLEPMALPLERVREEAPYWSEGWLAQHAELSRIPIVLVLRLRHP